MLRALSERLLDTSRTRDVLARYRWDEFVMALPETDVEAALRVAGRCCQAAQHCNFTFEGQEISFSVSAGVAECETGFIESEADLLRRAEGALARAKLRSGLHVARWSPGPDDATQAATTLQADETSLEQMAGRFRSLEHQLRQTCLESTRALVAAVEAKEPLTERHSMNVATYCATLANRMNVRPALARSLARHPVYRLRGRSSRPLRGPLAGQNPGRHVQQ